MAEFIRLSEIEPDAFPVYWFDIAREDHFWFRARLASFTNMMAKAGIDFNKPLDVLEIGCGNGLVRKQIEAQSKWISDGCDIQPEALKENPALRGKTYLYNIHERHEQFREKYDGIILFDVLEHIPDTRNFLESVLFHLKPGGWLILNVPALNKLRGKYDEVVGHIRRYDKAMMTAEFINLPVELILQRYWAMPLVPMLWLRELITPKNLDTKAVVRKGMEPPNDLINKLFGLLLAIGRTILPSPPIGASLLTCVRKLPHG